VGRDNLPTLVATSVRRNEVVVGVGVPAYALYGGLLGLPHPRTTSAGWESLMNHFCENETGSCFWRPYKRMFFFFFLSD
jgi:hypothetical protein